MTEQNVKYVVPDEPFILNQDTLDAVEMLGKGYHDEPSIELHPQTTVIRRRGRAMEEEVIPAFVKISTAFKKELELISGDALKVWLFIALSINRNTEEAHPGVRTIAKACRVGINQVTAYVKQLEEIGLLSVNREDRKYNLYKIPDYVSANTVTPQVTDGETVTSKTETVTPKRKTVTPISDLTREPEFNQNKSFPERKKEALQRKAEQRAKKQDPLGNWLNMQDPEKIAEYETIKELWNRLESALSISVTANQRERDDWKNVITYLLGNEKQGRTIEEYAQWAREHPYDAPTKKQLANQPWMIQNTFPAAFESQTSDNYRSRLVNRMERL